MNKSSSVSHLAKTILEVHRRQSELGAALTSAFTEILDADIGDAVNDAARGLGASSGELVWLRNHIEAAPVLAACRRYAAAAAHQEPRRNVSQQDYLDGDPAHNLALNLAALLDPCMAFQEEARRLYRRCYRQLKPVFDFYSSQEYSPCRNARYRSFVRQLEWTD